MTPHEDHPGSNLMPSQAQPMQCEPYRPQSEAARAALEWAGFPTRERDDYAYLLARWERAIA